jgi:hypothetical protein
LSLEKLVDLVVFLLKLCNLLDNALPAESVLAGFAFPDQAFNLRFPALQHFDLIAFQASL